MVLVSICLPSTVSIPSEITDGVVELALPLDSTPKFGTRQNYYKPYYSHLSPQGYLPIKSHFPNSLNYQV